MIVAVSVSAGDVYCADAGLNIISIDPSFIMTHTRRIGIPSIRLICGVNPWYLQAALAMSGIRQKPASACALIQSEISGLKNHQSGN